MPASKSPITENSDSAKAGAQNDNAAFESRHESSKLRPTPGPWQSRHEWDWDGLCSIIGNIDGDPAAPTYTNVCDLDEGCDEFMANRNLICAAPDLLEALKGLHYLVELADKVIAWESHGLGNTFAEAIERDLSAARSAISRAEGGK